MQQTYSKHPFASDMLEICSEIEKDKITHLADLNIHLILWILEKLEMNTEIFVSSKMSLEGKRTTRLISILKKLQANQVNT